MAQGGNTDVVESGTSGRGIAIVLAGLFSAVALLGLAVTPSHALPWRRAAITLDDKREELVLFGLFGLLATGVFFVLTVVVG